MKSIKYQESQSFFTWWVYILLAVLMAKAVYSLVQEGANQEISYSSLIVVLVVVLLLFWMRLRTYIDESGIVINFLPFIRNKHIKWGDIEKIYIEQYSLIDYGGWGYRRSGKGVAYTTKGKYGLQLVLKDGKHILIGTQRPQEVQQIIDT